MPQPVFTRNIKVLDHAADSSAVSSVVDVSDSNYLGMQVTWSGAALLGTLDLECSLDNDKYGIIDTITINGTHGTSVINTLIVAPYVRANFTYTSGTVVEVKVFICTKQSG
jgi:hypothetical protein